MPDLVSDPILPDNVPHSVPAQPAVTLHIEVALKESATCRFDAAHRYVEDYLRENYSSLEVDTEIKHFDEYAPILKNNVDRIYIVEVSKAAKSTIIKVEHALFNIHVYQLRDCEARFGDIETESDGGQSSFATATDLPAKSLDGLWDTLILEGDVKSSLLQYISSVMLFSDCGVNPYLVTCHRLVLLHGPPGTGKTSLCRGDRYEALAQKVAIRLSIRFSQSKLIELVFALFSEIYELTLDEEIFVCVLIDEVESITTARTKTIGSEPSDAMRVVNVLLTQLDRMKTRPNILVMATSNLPEISDPFLDRADIIQFIGNPTSDAIYEILRSCLLELTRVGVVKPSTDLRPHSEALVERWSQRTTLSTRLLDLSQLCSGLRTCESTSPRTEKPETVRQLIRSGRSLRRLPVLAHSRHIKGDDACSLDDMLSALSRTVQELP